jgi:hypothetical protein
MKKILIDVNCANEYYCEAPDHFIGELTEEQITKIKHLATMVKELDVYSIQYFDYSGAYLSSLTVSDFCEDSDNQLEQLSAEQAEKLEEESFRMELNQVEVFKDEFKFTAIPKHSGYSELCYTDRVQLDELDNPEPLIAVSY